MQSTPRLLLAFLVPSLSLLACGESGSPPSGTGGAAAGGGLASGGAASGGGPGSGGAASGGAMSGGATSAGGATSGGAANSGGGTSSGGVESAGGAATGGDGSGGSASDEFLLSGAEWEGVNNDDCTKEITEPCPTYPLESTNFGSPEKNISPEMSWSGAPEGTLSFAVVLSDLSNGQAHWVIYDIPADVTVLAKGLPAMSPLTDPEGAKQISFSGPAYFGSGACGNVYEHRLYALGVENLNPTGNMVSAVRTAVQDSDILGETFIRLQSRGCD